MATPPFDIFLFFKRVYTNNGQNEIKLKGGIAIAVLASAVVIRGSGFDGKGCMKNEFKFFFSCHKFI